MNQWERIPQELRAFNNWVCFSFEERNGKRTKVPYCPLTGKRAKSNDPSTWGSFTDAVDKADFLYDGIGFMFSCSPYVGIDLDHCIENGVMTDLAKDAIMTLQSYAEYSPSGTGVHIICRGQLPVGGNRNDKTGIEMYATGRYFTMTGNVIPGYEQIIENSAAIAAVQAKYIISPKMEKAIAGNSPARAPEAPSPTSGGIFTTSEDDIIKRAMASKQGQAFQLLYSGDWQAYKSQSEADLAFCNMLAFWTGQDASQMDAIFRNSGLMRPKWDERHGTDTYGNMTIQQAIADCKTVFDPQYGSKKKAAAHERNQETMTDVLKEHNWPVTEVNVNDEIVPIKAAFENTQYLCEALGIQFKYNLLTKEIDTNRADLKRLTFDAIVAKMRGICHKNFLKITKADLIDNIILIAEQNQYSPVCDYLNTCMGKWDGQSRIAQLFNCFELDVGVEQDAAFLQLLLRKWLITCVKLAFNDGSYAAQGVLVLCGPQGIGKTRFLYTLLPVPSWGASGMSLDPTVKDDVLAVIRFWIVELGELNDTLRKEKQDKLKAFFTRNSDNLRKPYKRASEEIARRTAFIGTVNGDGFLKDRTGERRYWVFSVKNVRNDETLNIHQLWGEVMHLAYVDREREWLNQEEIEKLNRQNEIYKKITSEEQLLLDLLDWDAPDMRWQWVTSTEICDLVGLPRTRNGLIGKTLKRIRDGAGRLGDGGKKIILPTNNHEKQYKVPPIKRNTDWSESW